MATNNDDIKWLYGKLKAKGYNIGSEQDFTSSLANEDDRNWYYEKAKGMGLNMGSIEDFNSLYAPEPVQAPAAEQQRAVQPQSAPTEPAPVREQATVAQSAPAESASAQPAWEPSGQEKMRMSYQMHTMLNDFNQKSKARLERIQRLAEPLTAEGRKKRETLENQARFAGTSTKVMGLTPPTSPLPDGERGEAAEKAATEQQAGSGQSPVPYGVKYVDGKPETQWLLPDGSLTTSYLEADQAEYGARTARLRHRFENRMKQNGLDPAKPEDVEMQAQLDAQGPAYEAVAYLWREAEDKHKADKERNANKHWDSYASMGGGREMRIVTTSMNRHDDNISHMTRFDIEKMMDNAWERAGSKITANCYNRLRQQYPGASEEELRATATEMARSLSDNAVYQYAVQQNTPKSTLEYFGRTVADMNVINSISKGLARSQAGTSGDLAAYEAAMGEYGQNHRVAQIAGTVAGMGVDPVTWVSGGVGSLAGKGAMRVGGRLIFGKAAPQVGARLFGNTLKGRIVAGAAAGAGNFAAYEGLKEAESQWLHGGHVNAETGEVEGYSAGEILKSSGHGLILGGVTGTLSPLIGNVADKAVKATSSTVGKAGVRFGEVAVSTLAEGTIFSVPQWISGEGDAFDVWTDNMAMMLGFKAQHGIKSAPRVIASLRPIKPTKGRPLTQAERNHNRMDFEERLRKSLDASPNDLAFTADEREELRRAGYGELGDLFSRDRAQEARHPNINPEEGAIDLRTERVEAETGRIKYGPETVEEIPIYETNGNQIGVERKVSRAIEGFELSDGYSAMEELMQDGRISQTARAKAYYILTGRMLPMGTVTGYTKTTTDDGRVTISATTADGEIVTSRTFKNEQESKPEVDNIMRQAELNSVDVGERYNETVADEMVLDAAIREVSPGADPATVKRIYQAVKVGNKDVSEAEIQLAEVIDEAIARNSRVADEHRPEAIRNTIKEETEIDVDAALRKMPSKRTEAEQNAIRTYLERLFPEETRQQNAEPSPEQAEAQSQYERGRLLYGRFEEEDPTVRAEVDAIALRMQEAKQAVADVFGAEAEYYMSHVDENPWALVNDPGLTAEQQDAVLYYINAKAALDGVMDASNEAAERKRDEVSQSVDKRTHKDGGVIIPATMKVNDRQVYIVKGDVVMFEDGTAVDVRNSSESVVVMDAQTGEYEFTSPDQIFKVSEPLNPEDELDVALSVIEQEQMNIFGQNAVAPEEPMAEAPEIIPQNGNNDAENIPQNGNNVAENIPAVDETPVAQTETVLSRIPTDEKGEPMFEQAENAEIGWDALVEYSEGDAATAKEIADAMVDEKRKAYEKAQKQKPKGKTPTEILTSKKAIATELSQAEREYGLWQQMANVEQRRQNAIRSQEEAEARQRAAGRAEAEKAEREAREEAERIQREALEGIPEWHMDTPDNARKRGARRFGGEMIVRQEPLQGVVGDEVEVKFSDKDMPKGRAVVIEASQLQPSHLQGRRNPMFFIDESQPKNRADEVSMLSAQEIAKGIRPKEITGNATAYTGAPTVNTRGEVIQGNNRSDALRYLWGNNLPEQQREYKQYLLDNAEQFGIDRDAVSAMRNPVLVNIVDVGDAEAIRLGQMTSQDTESGGEERIKPQNVALKLGDEMRTFANRLLNTGDEDASFGQLVDRNGAEVLEWMNQIGAISNTQYKSAFDTKGNLTAEAKNDLQKVLYQAVFKGGSKQLEEMFEKLPAKAQRAILSTAFRDMDSPVAGRMLPEIQASVVAYHELMNDKGFANAKRIEDVLRAVDAFKRATALDDRLEQYHPADNFSNFALHLAAMYKASDMSQSTIASYFNQMYDLAQGKKAATLFEEADATQYPLAEIIKQVLNIDYQPAKNGNNNVANGGADVALRNQNGQGGELRGDEPPASREQASSGTEPSERGEGAEYDIRRVGTEQAFGKWANDNVATREARIREWLSDENLEWAEGKSLDEILEHFGNELQPIAVIPTEFLKYLGDDANDTNVYCGKGYFIDHAVNHHDEEPVEEYLKIQEILYSPTDVKLDTSKGRPTLLFIKQYDKYYVEMVSVGEDGTNRVVLHKSFFHRKKMPHKGLPSVAIKGSSADEISTISPTSKNEAAGSSEFSALDDNRKIDTSSENGTIYIGHSDKSESAISLESHGDVVSSERKFSDSVSEKQEKKGESSSQRPYNSGFSAQQVTDEAASAKENAELTEAQKETTELDENGLPFVISENGTTTFGVIREESGLPGAPIKLSEGYQDENGKGYGLRHIEAGHGEEIRKAGFSTVEEFVSYVAKNYDEDNIRVGKQRRNGNTTYLIQVTDSHDNTLFIELSRDGSYWNINTAGIFKTSYGKNAKEVYNRHTTDKPIAESVEASQDSALSGTTESSRMNAPTSERKFSDSVSEKQEKKGESSSQLPDNSEKSAQQVTDEAASAKENAEPTEAQKAAGNYKMEHRRVDGYNISIENAKGSVRRGVGADGKPWETTMQNDYGYIRGTEGVDGDHIDVFLSGTPEEGDVFVVDQVNEDGSFDEHKVMYGFPSEQAAREAYLSNYEPGWIGLGAITHVSKEEFKKWIQTSKRKTKPFAEYRSVRVYKEQNPQLAIEPDGFSDFGPVFTQFKGNAQGAIKVLSELKDGEAIGALHHKDIGDIDLVWGNAGTAKSDGFGLAKLVKYHPEVVEHLQEILDDMHIVKRSENRINLESDTHKAAVRLTWNKEKKKWLLTAFEKKETPKSIDKTTDTGDNPTDLRGGTALSQNSGVSDGKDNTLSIDKQTDRAESSEDYTITPTTYTNKKGKTSDVHLVKFNRELTTEEKAALESFVREPLADGKKTSRGWYDRKEGGYMMRSEEAARQLAEMLGNEEAVADAQPMTVKELREAVGAGRTRDTKPKKAPINRVNVEDLMTDLSTKGETKLSEHAEPVKVEHEVSDEEMNSLLQELRDLLGIGDDEGDVNFKFRDPGELSAQERQQIQSAGIRVAMGLLSRGTTLFPDYATKMVVLLGDKIRPWLKSFYEGARWTPGYEKYEFTPSEQVATFDVQNFDKSHGDPIAQAAMIVEERKAAAASQQAQKELTETRNKIRKENDKQREADTRAVAEKADVVASKAESVAKTSTDERALNRASEEIDRTLDEVNDRLALLGYYEADLNSPEHEIYGLRRSAEKKAVKDAAKLAKQLIQDLGIDIDKATQTEPDRKGKTKKKPLATSNLTGIDGDITINLPMRDGRNLYINIGLSPTHERGVETRRGGGAWEGDNYEVDRIMFRIEGSEGRRSENRFLPIDVTYGKMLSEIERVSEWGKPRKSIVGRTLSEREATDLIARMEANAEVAPAIELTPENWIAQFGDDGTVKTPIGIVKMGANQLQKLYSLKRTEYFGMMHPTLNTPDVILEEADPKEGSERDSKYLYVKTFVKSDGSRIVHFESVTVKRDGMEVSISSHEIKDKSLKNKMQNDIVLHLDEKLSPSSEMRLTKTPSVSEGPDLVPTSDNVSFDGKDNTLSIDKQTDGAESSLQSEEDRWRRMVEMAESGKSPYTVTQEVEHELAEQRKAQSEYKPGDEVEYSADGKKWEKAKVVEIDNDGVPVLDTGMAPVLYVRGNEGQIRRPKETFFEEAARVAKEAQEKKKENPAEKGWTSKPTSILSTNGNGAKVTNLNKASKSTAVKNTAEVKPEQPIGDLFGGLFGVELLNSEQTKSIGKSIFGEIYDQYRGKVKEAVELLMTKRGGDILGVFSRKDFGDVDFVWGDTNAGFAHILDKHVGVGKSFATAEDAALEIDRVIKHGEIAFDNGDKIVFKDGTKLVTVRKNLRERGKKIADKNWVLTAYDNSGADNTSAISKVDSTQAAPIGTPKIEGKVNDKSSNIKGNERTDVQPRTGAAERERGHEPRQNESMGTSQRNEAEGIDGRGMGGRDNVNPMSDGGRGGSVSGQPKSQSVLERPAESKRKNVRNNHAERGVDYAPKGEDARIKANIEAIELAKQLLEAGETATPEQMAILRKFSGWGGLGKAFNETGYTPNPTAKRLRELLGEQGYQDAVDSRRSAYYTPANVIDAMWDVVRAMGFKGGNVLEGSAGIGNILGLMPTDMSERSSIHAVEIDSTTGGILSLLYPDAKVEIQGFEKTKVPNGSVDLAITNVPFITGAKVFDETGDKDLSRKFRDIHDFCIAKNVRKLREGGIGIFITSSGTMDNSKELRRWIINEGNADVVGAFRMHNKTFGGTGATSDIIVVRKRVNGKPSPNAIDVSDVTGVRVADYDTGKTRKVKGKETPVINQLSMVYNKYFAEHPENMAGEMLFNFERGETRFPTSRALFPIDGKEQSTMLTEWAHSFSEMKEESAVAPKVEDEVVRINERLGEGVKEGSIVLNSKGELCMARKGEAVPLGVNKNKVKGHTKAECFEAYSAIKKALSSVLEYQSSHESDEGLTPLLKELNRAFDTFTKTYGNLHKNTAISFLRNDVDFSSILALETYSEKGDKKGNKVVTVGKTDIFSRRVIETEKEPQPTTIKDGILASLYKNGGVDVEYIGKALGKSTEEVKREIVESGLGFEDPSTGKMEVSYKYLSGNVREKLNIAQENNEGGRYDANIKALENAMPMNIPAHLIEFTLGSSWIEPKLYEDFVSEKTGIRVKLTNVGGTWFMKTPWSTFNEKNRAMAVVSKMCDKTIMGHELIEAAITNRQITVSKTVKNHYDGTTETITDKSATAECGAKVDEIRAEFKDWAREHMQADAEMSARIEQTYNEQFNNYVPMTIPDEFVPKHFGGQVSELHGKPFALRPHQGRAVVRGTTEPILLAHEVGTGKTYTLITTAMEMRRLGTARKPMIVVQNSTVGQFVASAKEIYPKAKVLTIEDSDRTAEGRKNFYAKIKYNDWDMIVVPQSVFELIPDSPEREMAYVKDIIEEKMKVLETMREADGDGKNMIVRQAERELAEQENRLAELTEAMQGRKKKRDEKREATTRHNAEVRALEMLDRKVDDVEDFDDMGIDAILVDEAHEYKHLGFATAMQRGVKGVDSSNSKKSQGVYLKTQAVMERNNGRNVVFATGTPISNTAAEIWTFMRYLMPADTMKSYGIYYFDDFVRNFGNISQMVEFGTNGKFKENNRFAGYVNLPELVRIWSSVADTVLTREAGGVSDKIPDMEGGKPQDLYLPQTRVLRSVMKHVKSELEKFEQMSGREKRENSHIPLTMYGIAKAAAIDVRLVMSSAEDDVNSKTNATVRETLRSLKDSAKYKGTVAIFSDNYRNKHSGFNLYEDIRNKLIAEGVPADQVAIIKSGMTIKKKLEIFEKVNAGEIRVVMGSTFTLGTGVNIQERLHTLIHVDAPNRPMDYTQRNGRALRQGNMHKDMGIPVRIIRFGVEDSLDVTAYQRLKTKGAIADSIMNGSKLMQNSMENRVLEEEEDTFGDMTAQLSGSEYAILKNQAEREVRSLTAKQKGHDIDQIYVHNQLPKVEGFIRGAEQRIALETKNLEIIGKHFPDGTIKKITVGKLTFDSVGSMEEFFKEQNAKMNEAAEAIREGAENYTSKLVVDVDGLKFEVTTTVDRTVDNKGQGSLTFEPERKVTYSCEELGIKDAVVKGNRLKNVMQHVADEIATGKSSRELLSRGEQQLAHYSEEKRQLDARKGAEFPFKQQLEEAKERLAKYEEAMKEELAEKEAKYAEMDKDVEEATDVSYTEEDDEETATNGDGNKYRLVEDANNRFNKQLERYINGDMEKNEMLDLGKPLGVMSQFLPELPIVMRQRILKKGSIKKHNVEVAALANMPQHLASPIFVFQRSDNALGILTEMQDQDGKNVCVAIELNRKIQDGGEILEVNDIRSVHGRNVADIVFPIVQNGTLKWADKEKGLAYLSSASRYVQQEIDKQDLDSVAKVVENFENPTLDDENIRYQDAYESSAEAKESRVLDLSDKLNTPVRLISSQEEIDALPNRRQRRAKGWWSDKDNSIVIVVPNNVNVADIENTFVHEVVGHKGLRALIGADRFDEFLGEVYDHASEPIRNEIDKKTNAMVDAEADRLRVRKAQEHEQAGEDVNSHYYTDMAEARVEAEKKREQYRKEATEEYMADMAGKIGDEGFEKMNREEQTLWSKIKAKVQQFLDKFLQGLKIAKSIKLTDKDLAYILFKSWKNMRGDKGVFAQAEDAVMRYRTDWDKSMESRNAIVEETNKRFNEELQQQIDGTLPEGHVYQLGTPSEVLLSTGVPNLPIQLSAQRLKVKATEYGHNFDLGEIQNLVKELQNPMAVFVYGNKGKMQNIIVGIESNGNQFIVGLSLNPIVQGRALEINSVRNVFPKKNAEWLNWISQGKLLYADKQKIQALIDKQRTNLADVEYLDLEDVAKIVNNFENPTLDDDKIVRYRDGDDIIAKTPVLARGMYEQRVASSSYQVREALQDSMLGLKEAYLAIEKASGRKQYIEDIAGFENAYLWENRLSSKNKAEQGAYERLVIKPMLDEVARLAPSESKRVELTEYMMAKHGLERNALMRSNAVADGMDQKAADATDFAGLTGLFATTDVADAEDMARTYVSDYESTHNTDELWNKVNAATKATLSKLKECGLLSAATHDNIANMYDNYIPLRGWAETTADEVYGYLSRNDGNLRGSVLKKAEGRKSVADDPIATIALMGEQAIAQANRNKMKQAFFNYVRRHPSDLVSVNRLWLQRNDVTDEWEPVFASNIKDDDDAATVQQKIDAFEQKMESMAAAEPDKYKRGRQARGIPYKLGTGALNEHTVLVKCGDDTYVMTINGNPRAAQALNGLTNPDVSTGGWQDLIFGFGEKINHAIAPIYTTRNPDFMVSNFLRDALYTNTMTWVKESPRYAARFNANFLSVNPIRMARLVNRYNNNTLDMNDPIERKFHEFIMEGGETGYTNQRDIEKHKKAVKKMLKRANGRISFGKVMDVLAEKWDVLNSAAENCARFAAYLTSLEEGRSVERAIYDAKEISVNFNKKGSGATFMRATGQTYVGKGAAFISGAGRGLFVFWNAVVQSSIANFMRNAVRHPFKMAGGIVVPIFLLGAVQAILGAFDDGQDDDDENNDGRHDYFNQPDYVRRSNILLRVGDQYLAHPLPHEYLAVFGLGEMAATLMMGKDEMSAGEISVEIAKMLSEFSPIPVDRAGWDHAVMPSSVKPLYEASINESWTGMPIYKQNPYNEDLPEWTKAYSSANHQLVNLAEATNRYTGGDAYTKGDIDFNPAQVEYVLNGYLGGYFKIADRMIKMYETATGEREFEWRNMPLANRVVKQGDERTAMRSVNNAYFEYQNEYENIRRRIRSYEKEADNGIFEYAAKLAELSRTPEFHRYWILDGYQSEIRAINKDLKEATTETELEKAQKERDELRTKIVGKLDGITTLERADTTGLGEARSYYERKAMQQ